MKNSREWVMMFLSERGIDMEKEIQISKTVETKTFKAKFKATRPHFIQKVIGHRTELKDALNSRFRNAMTVFMPKLSPRYQKPCIMLQLGNGSSSTLIRAKGPIVLASWLEDMALTLRSDKWLDLWEQLLFTSENLVYGEDPSILDEQFMDIKEFNHAFIEHGKEMLTNERC